MTGRAEVHKFSTSCLRDAGSLRSAAALVTAASESASVVVVVSALEGTSATLAEAAQAAATGNRERGLQLLAAVLDRHETVLSELGGPAERDTRAELNAIVGELRDLVRGAVLVGELTPRTRDRILAAGEKMSARLFAVCLAEAGIRPSVRDADEFLETDNSFGAATVISDVAGRTISSVLRATLESGGAPVVTGHIGRAPDGATTTLGKGGSDLTATLIAAALRADEVTIWTVAEGVYTAAPDLEPNARVIDHLNYREAAELSYYGIDALHLSSILPIRKLGVPIRIRNSADPSKPGTLVTGRFTAGPSPVKGVAAARGQCLVSVESSGVEPATRIVHRVVGALDVAGARVTMISQSSSEASICLAVPTEQARTAETALKREFRHELTRGFIDDISVRRHTALVAAIGLGMRDTPGVAARLFAALGSRGVNVIACAQGSSQFNVTIAVDEDDVAEAVQGIHRDFGLHETGRAR